FSAPATRSAEVMVKLKGLGVKLEVMATTTTSCVWLFYRSFEITMTGRRRLEVRSVNGTGTRTMSPWLGVVSVLVSQRIVRDFCTAFRRVHQVARILRLRGENQNLHPRSGGNRHLHLELSVRTDLRLKLVRVLGHGKLRLAVTASARWPTGRTPPPRRRS